MLRISRSAACLALEQRLEAERGQMAPQPSGRGPGRTTGLDEFVVAGPGLVGGQHLDLPTVWAAVRLVDGTHRAYEPVVNGLGPDDDDCVNASGSSVKPSGSSDSARPLEDERLGQRPPFVDDVVDDV